MTQCGIGQIDNIAITEEGPHLQYMQGVWQEEWENMNITTKTLQS